MYKRQEVNLIGYGIISMDQYLNMMTTVGASGAVYAILLAFGMLYPNNQLFIDVYKRQHPNHSITILEKTIDGLIAQPI